MTRLAECRTAGSDFESRHHSHVLVVLSRTRGPRETTDVSEDRCGGDHGWSAADQRCEKTDQNGEAQHVHGAWEGEVERRSV